MNTEQKAVEVLRAIAERVAKGKSITISYDWGFGSATVTDHTGAHTHVGGDWYDNDDIAFAAFVGGLHDLLVAGRGLSWAKP